MPCMIFQRESEHPKGGGPRRPRKWPPNTKPHVKNRNHPNGRPPAGPELKLDDGFGLQPGRGELSQASATPARPGLKNDN
eukprot:7504810-Alexandrium_andersonii.AAC.1